MSKQFDAGSRPNTEHSHERLLKSLLGPTEPDAVLTALPGVNIPPKESDPLLVPEGTHDLDMLSVRVPLVGSDGTPINAPRVLRPLARTLTIKVASLFGTKPADSKIIRGTLSDIVLVDEGNLPSNLLGRVRDNREIPHRRILEFLSALGQESSNRLRASSAPHDDDLCLTGSIRKGEGDSTVVRIALATSVTLASHHTGIRAALGQRGQPNLGIDVLTFETGKPAPEELQKKLDEILHNVAGVKLVRQLRLGGFAVYNSGTYVMGDPSVPPLKVEWLSTQKPADAHTVLPKKLQMPPVPSPVTYEPDVKPDQAVEQKTTKPDTPPRVQDSGNKPAKVTMHAEPDAADSTTLLASRRPKSTVSKNVSITRWRKRYSVPM